MVRNPHPFPDGIAPDMIKLTAPSISTVALPGLVFDPTQPSTNFCRACLGDQLETRRRLAPPLACLANFPVIVIVPHDTELLGVLTAAAGSCATTPLSSLATPSAESALWTLSRVAPSRADPGDRRSLWPPRYRGRRADSSRYWENAAGKWTAPGRRAGAAGDRGPMAERDGGNKKKRQKEERIGNRGWMERERGEREKR